MKSNVYWERRAKQRMASYHRSADSTIHQVAGAYDQALKNLNAEIEAIYKTFGYNGLLDRTTARKVLNETISRAEWKALRNSLAQIQDPAIQRQVLARLNAPAYRARITRLEALREQAYIQSKMIADVELRVSRSGYVDIINEAYYRTMFDIQKGLGTGFEFATMPNRVIETILKRPWSGQHFSQRIWGNTDTLANQLTAVLTGGFMSGAGVATMRRQLEDITGVGKYAAARLIRTETTYMANAAEMESYEELGINQYVYVATLDKRTSPICQELDGKIFKVKDAKPGENLPPMHPNCRSTTRAYLGQDELDSRIRRARNSETGETHIIPGNMTYEQWRQQYAPREKTSNTAVVKATSSGYNQSKSYVTSAKDIFSQWNKQDRKVFADELLQQNGLNLQAQVHPFGAFGQCMLQTGDPDAMQVQTFELNSADNRAHRYQVKTTFHELFHAKAHGLKHDSRAIGFSSWAYCDDIFAEISAHYFTRELGIAGEITPSYAEYLVSALPKLKQLPDFAACSSIADFGAVAAEYRFGPNPTAEWSAMFMHIRDQPIDILAYGKHYVDYIEQNAQSLIDQLLETSPQSVQYKPYMLNDLNRVVDAIRNAGVVSTGNEKYVLNGVLSIAMNREGVIVP